MDDPTGPSVLRLSKEQGLEADLLLRDRDCKFVVNGEMEEGAGFDATLKAAGVNVNRLSIRSPNLNAYIERFVQSIGQECLDKFIIFGQEHLDRLSFTDKFNTQTDAALTRLRVA